MDLINYIVSITTHQCTINKINLFLIIPYHHAFFLWTSVVLLLPPISLSCPSPVLSIYFDTLFYITLNSVFLKRLSLERLSVGNLIEEYKSILPELDSRIPFWLDFTLLFTMLTADFLGYYWTGWLGCYWTGWLGLGDVWFLLVLDGSYFFWVLSEQMPIIFC